MIEADSRRERYKRTTQTAIDWRLNHNPDAWEHLIAICLTALEGLYLPTPDIRVERNGLLQYERNDLRTKRQFIEEFLLVFFRTYANSSPSEIHDAAARGEFQRIGYNCKSAMIDKIRKCTAQKRSAFELSIDVPIPGLDGKTYAEAIEDRQQRDIDHGGGPSFQQRVRDRIEELGGFQTLARDAGQACVESLLALLESVDGFSVDESVFERAAARRGVGVRQLRRDIEHVRLTLDAMATRKRRSSKAN